MSESLSPAQLNYNRPATLRETLDEPRGRALETDHRMVALFGHQCRTALYTGEQGNRLVYNAQSHTRYEYLSLLKEFLPTIQDPEKWVVLTEKPVRSPRAGQLGEYPDREIFEKYGDDVYIQHLAHEYNLCVEAPDISRQEFIDYLEPGSEELYALSRFMIYLYNYQIGVDTIDEGFIKKKLAEWVQYNNGQGKLFSGLGLGHEVTYAMFCQWHEEYLGTPLDLHENAEKYVSPNMPGTATSDLALYQSSLRDAMMLNRIVELMKQGKNVAACFGASHLTLHDPVLREQFDLQFMSRMGQTSGDIILGSLTRPEEAEAKMNELLGKREKAQDALTRNLLDEELYSSYHLLNKMITKDSIW